MSPRRPRGVQHVPTHSRREVTQAVVGPIVVVVLTLLLIWMMRPGSVTPGTGGLLHRQPRAGWLVAAALVALVALAWAVWRPGSTVRQRPLVTATGTVGVLLLAVIGAVVWPGGLLHHYQSEPTLPTPTSSPISVAPTPSSVAPTSAAPTSVAPTSATASSAPGTTAPASAPSTTGK